MRTLGIPELEPADAFVPTSGYCARRTQNLLELTLKPLPDSPDLIRVPVAA